MLVVTAVLVEDESDEIVTMAGCSGSLLAVELEASLTPAVELSDEATVVVVDCFIGVELVVPVALVVVAANDVVCSTFITSGPFVLSSPLTGFCSPASGKKDLTRSGSAAVESLQPWRVVKW